MTVMYFNLSNLDENFLAIDRGFRVISTCETLISHMKLEFQL